MWKWYTAKDRRDAVTAWLILVALAALVMVGSLVVPAVVLAGEAPSLRVFSSVFAALAGTPVDELWPGVSTLGYWALTAGVLIASGVAAFFLTRWLWWATLMPVGVGFADRTEVDREMSEGASRKKATVLRPDLKRWRARTSVPIEGLALPIGLTPWRTRLWLPLENTFGVLAPTQSGKSLMVLLHHLLTAPGACLTTSTKPDLFLLTALERERRTPGHVAVFDLTGQAPWPNRVRWNPIDGCTNPRVAYRRAESLLAAAASEGNENHAFFVRNATDVLAANLLAAALGEIPLERFVRWCQSPEDAEPAQILERYPEYVTQRHQLMEAMSLVPETRDGIWATLRDGIAALTDGTVIEACLPRAGEEPFSATQFLRDKGTVYVLGSEADAARQASLITAFVEHCLETAKQEAFLQDGGKERLTPAFVSVLDEFTNICPIPSLPDTMSDSAGRGIVIVWAAQSKSQLETRWGPRRAESLLDNTTALGIFGGLKSESSLKWASLLSGERDDERRSHTSNGWLDARSSTSSSLQRESVLTAAQIREIPRGRALLIFRHMRPLIVRWIPGWTRGDWRKLQADAATLRSRGRLPGDALEDFSAGDSNTSSRESERR